MNTELQLNSEVCSLGDIYKQVSKELKVIRNETGHAFNFQLSVEEFSSYCPLTGHPDYATIEIHGEIPNGGNLIEQKSLRDWLNSFRTVDGYQEEITCAIFDMFKRHGVNVIVTAYWKGRGGMTNVVTIG